MWLKDQNVLLMSGYGQQSGMKSLEKIQLLVILLLFWYVYWLQKPVPVKQPVIKPSLGDQLHDKATAPINSIISEEKDIEPKEEVLNQSSSPKPIIKPKQEPKPEPKTKTKPESEPEPDPEANSPHKDQAKPNPEPKSKPGPQVSKPKPNPKAESNPQGKPNSKPKSKPKSKNKPKVYSEPKPKPKSKPHPKPGNKVHALILAYMRTGSTVFGQLLGQYNKTFYRYEPLHFYNSRANNWTEFSNEFAIKLIQNIYKCQFESTEMSVYAKNHTLGNVMAFQLPYYKNSCRKQKNCTDPMTLTKMCQESQINLIKTVRLRSSALKTLMKQDPKLKVILLVRDPRGLINSRRHGFCGKKM